MLNRLKERSRRWVMQVKHYRQAIYMGFRGAYSNRNFLERRDFIVFGSGNGDQSGYPEYFIEYAGVYG